MKWITLLVFSLTLGVAYGQAPSNSAKKGIKLEAYGKLKVAEQQSFSQEVAKMGKQIRQRDSVYQLFIIQSIQAAGVSMRLVSFSGDSLKVTSDSIILKLRRPRK